MLFGIDLLIEHDRQWNVRAKLDERNEEESADCDNQGYWLNHDAEHGPISS